MASSTSPIPNSSSTTSTVFMIRCSAFLGAVVARRTIDTPAEAAQQRLDVVEAVAEDQPVLAEGEFAQDRVEIAVADLQDRDQAIEPGMQLDIAHHQQVLGDGRQLAQRRP